MSRIIVCTESEEQKKITIDDVNNIPRSLNVKVCQYHPQKDINVVIQTDYLGNIYIKHIYNSLSANVPSKGLSSDKDNKNNEEKDKYYIVSLDSYTDPGVILTPIKNPNNFRNNLLDCPHLAKSVK